MRTLRTLEPNSLLSTNMYLNVLCHLHVICFNEKLSNRKYQTTLNDGIQVVCVMQFVDRISEHSLYSFGHFEQWTG